MSSIILSVIIPMFNPGAELIKCLDSLVIQRDVNFEIIIVDDGSTDDSQSILKKYINKGLNIHVVEQKRKGSGEARNKGLDLARGKIIYFMDSDDSLVNNTFKENVNQMESAKSDIHIFGFYSIYHKNNKKMITKTSNQSNEIITSNLEFRERFIHLSLNNMNAVWNKFYRKSFLDTNNIRFSSQSTSQDGLFNIEIFKIIEKISINSLAYYEYHYYPTSSYHKYRKEKLVNERNLINSYRSLFLLWNKLDDQKFKKYIWKMEKELLKKAGLENLYSSDLSFFKKIKILKDLLNEEDIATAIQMLSKTSHKDKVFSYLAKHKKPYLLYFIYTLNRKIKGF